MCTTKCAWMSFPQVNMDTYLSFAFSSLKRHSPSRPQLIKHSFNHLPLGSQVVALVGSQSHMAGSRLLLVHVFGGWLDHLDVDEQGGGAQEVTLEVLQRHVPVPWGKVAVVETVVPQDVV